ncbi:MMPL family transporter [Streptococcus macedonicus]|uniref:MMPL family transporter n=1 Tax=Streptococcus macedonicus TaxID=59310 RepID=UPI00224397E6|nr:MMPL family transporter [Streptococcus macedonicus]MCW8519227.1 MMPL family transporter [Streptococcus macedonicus]MCW8521458.1 MMPL family transporter [Streptococcus macedonicus]
MVILPEQQQNLTKNNIIGYATVTFKKAKEDVKQSSINHLVKATKITKDAGIETELTGDLTISEMDTGEESEIYGLLAAIIILAITFASVIMAGMPILSALIGLGISVLGVVILSNWIKFTTSDLSLSGMIGLAVGIDYAFFIISRYRQEIKKGHSREESLAKSMTTAGKAVIFAGTTVIVALLAMSTLGISFLSVMGFAGALSVLGAMLTASTIIPAVIVLLGKIATGEKQNRVLARFGRLKRDYGWGKFVNKFKLLLSRMVLLGLIVVALPARNMNLGLPTDADKSTKTTERRAYDIMTEGYGAGHAATLVVLVKTGDSETAQDVATKLQNTANVERVIPPMIGNGKSGQYYMITLIPKIDGNAVATKNLVKAIRAKSNKNGNPTLLVTGSTAINIDMSGALLVALPKFALNIVAFAFVLSLLATLGALVFIVQEGHFDDLIGLAGPSAILNFLPVLVIGIMFGLAMDYEVFLISRMKEVYDETGDTQKALLEGMKDNGKAIFAVILIMVSVFMGFFFAADSTVKSMGLALTLGIFFDTLIVRMILVPAMLAVFGKANWYLPK